MPEPEDEETITLFRPVGKGEMEMIRDTRRFPPRLPWQPIFYPVLDEAYAVEIARDWNTKDPASGHVGYVTRFVVKKSFLVRYDVHTVGAAHHREYWIPAEDLAELNQNLVGGIDVIAEFHGSRSRP